MTGCVDDNLIWIDLEMTGLKPEADSIIEIATVVTDRNLNILAEGPEFAIRHEEARLLAMDDWNRHRPRARRSRDRRVPRALGAVRQVADVRQLDLPGPALPVPADAGTRTIFPLPQSRRVDAEGAGAPLGTHGGEGFQQGFR